MKSPTSDVGVIGAGASGLIFAARLLEPNSSSPPLSVTLFDRYPSAGGIWTRPKSLDPESPLYDGLQTNLPLRVMQIGEHFPFVPEDVASADDDDNPPRRPRRRPFTPGMYAHHSAVRRYLSRFAKSKDLLRHVRFETTVTSVTKQGELWQVETNRGEKLFFRFIVVANGHYNSAAAIPAPLRGLSSASSSMPSRPLCIHSLHYKSPQDTFGDSVSSVLVVGAGPSGRDIVAETVEWASKKKSSCRVGWVTGSKNNLVDWRNLGVVYHSDVEITGAAPDTNGKCRVSFSDGSSAVYDRVVAATGFVFDFHPFLSRETLERDLGVEVVCNGRAILGLWEHLTPVRDATICFAGLPIRIIPFLFVDSQAAVMRSLWSSPSPINSAAAIAQRKREYEADLHRHLNEEKKALRHFMFMELKMFDYMNRMRRRVAATTKNSCDNSCDLPRSLIGQYKASGMLQRRLPPGQYQECVIEWDEKEEKVVVMMPAGRRGVVAKL